MIRQLTKIRTLALYSLMIIPLKDFPSQFDPQKTETVYDMVLNLQIHRGLMRYLPNLDIAPDIAESLEVLDSGKRVRFVLADRKFSDGTPIRAHHVVNTFRRMFVSGSGFAADMEYIQGASEFLNKKPKGSDALKMALRLGVVAIDDRTVEFTLTQPVSVFLAHLSAVDAAILPVQEDLSYDWKSKVGAGPYKIKNLSKASIELEAVSPKFVQGSADQLKFVLMTADEAIAGALKGEIDSLDGTSVPEEKVAELKKQGWEESVSTITRQLFISLNPKKVSASVRETVFRAVVSSPDGLLPKPYSKSYGLIPDTMPGALPSDILKVKTPVRLKKAEKLKVTYSAAEISMRKLVENLKTLLAPLNIVVVADEVPLDQYMKIIKAKNYQAFIRSKFLDYPDGISVLTYFRSDYSANTFFVADKKVDSLLNQAFGELNKERRLKLYHKIQLQILSHYTTVPLLFGADNRGLWSRKAKFVPAHPLGVQGLPMELIQVQ